MNSWISSLLSACLPPFIIFINGIGIENTLLLKINNKEQKQKMDIKMIEKLSNVFSYQKNIDFKFENKMINIDIDKCEIIENNENVLDIIENNTFSI